MIPETNYKDMKAEREPHIQGDDGGCQSEAFRAQLEEANFIGSFMAAVSTSLELDGICSTAARVLYTHAPYDRIAFVFSTDLEDRIIAFSPAVRKGILAAKSKVALDTAYTPFTLFESSGASVRFDLQDDLGTILIYYKPGHGATFSDSLRASIVACFSQAIRNALQHGRMKDLAMRDGLTGLFNRWIFDETLAQQVASPDKHPVSLLLLDLDNFKQVNDTYGHQAGDQVLKAFARILKESCRGHDVVARFGGEEFAIILTRTKTVTAHAIAQRIRDRLAKQVFTFDGRPVQATASIGLTTCRGGDAVVASNFVKQADQALYQAKLTGKNKVCVFPHDLLKDAAPAPVGEGYGSLATASC
ncbi:GGDEF domain-containing protein [Geobacter sp. AOG2]|uniref:GGDEF domain-containing protein n=1 Tax=Geobacter sp. AOG2 TaxID=1566347 RepID=UPI001CC4628A|nr:GGDEF domain-containing protein [Geobacter sp. AOG2]GFE60295.1 hypothetical protein AOG2_08830 [Geobacter sp. AOG2]